MSLRIHDHTVLFIYLPIGVLVLEVVNLRIGHLSVALGEVPKEAVVNGSTLHSGRTGIPTTQQTQLLLEERIELVLESKDR